MPFSGSRKRHFVTFALTAIVFLSGGSLYYWHAKSVRISYDGITRRIYTKAATLNDFLKTERIELGPLDFITPSLETPIGHNTAAKITRVQHIEYVDISSAPARVTSQTNTRQNLRRVLVQKGFTDVTHKRVLIIQHDGVEVERAMLSSKTTRVPFYTLTLLDRAGRPEETYDLLASRVLYMRATGYYVGEKTVPSDTTFLGYKLRRGLVAVDPKVIPLRTRLYVQGYGYAYAADTGSAIKRMRIDLAVRDKKEEVRYNRRHMPVYVLEKAKTW